MTDEIDLDLLATASTLAGPGESTDTRSLATALDRGAGDGTAVDDVDGRLARLAREGLVDLDGTTLTVTPEGWTAIQPEYPT